MAFRNRTRPTYPLSHHIDCRQACALPSSHPLPVLSIKLLKLVSLCILWSVLTPSNITGAETCQAFLPATLPTTPRGLGPWTGFIHNYPYPQPPIFHLPGGWIAVLNTGYFSWWVFPFPVGVNFRSDSWSSGTLLLLLGMGVHPAMAFKATNGPFCWQSSLAIPPSWGLRPCSLSQTLSLIYGCSGCCHLGFSAPAPAPCPNRTWSDLNSFTWSLLYLGDTCD